MGFDYEDNDGLVVCIPRDPFTEATVEKRGKDEFIIRMGCLNEGKVDFLVTREAAEQLCVALWSNQSLGPWTLGELRKLA